MVAPVRKERIHYQQLQRKSNELQRESEGGHTILGYGNYISHLQNLQFSMHKRVRS